MYLILGEKLENTETYYNYINGNVYCKAAKDNDRPDKCSSTVFSHIYSQ